MYQVDKEFLEKQVEEKNRQKIFEKNQEKQLDETLIQNSKLAIKLEKQLEDVGKLYIIEYARLLKISLIN